MLGLIAVKINPEILCPNPIGIPKTHDVVKINCMDCGKFIRNSDYQSLLDRPPYTADLCKDCQNHYLTKHKKKPN